jgi:hypothetical protein
MKRTTRRDFLWTAGLIVAGFVGGSSAYGSVTQSYTVVQVQSVSAFSAPFLVQQLKLGQPLDVLWKQEKACLILREYLLGWLPEPAAQAWKQSTFHGQPPKVQVEKTDRNCEDRLRLFVKILPKMG